MNAPLQCHPPASRAPATLLLPRLRAMFRNMASPRADARLPQRHTAVAVRRPVDSVGVAEGEVLQFRQALRDFLDSTSGDPA